MTRWGLLLLVLYLGLGLSSTRLGKAVTLSVCVTTLVIAGLMTKYAQ